MSELVLDRVALPRALAGAGHGAQDPRGRSGELLGQRLHAGRPRPDVVAQVGGGVRARGSGRRHEQSEHVGGQALLARWQRGHRRVEVGGEDALRTAE